MLKKETLSNLEWLRDVHSNMLKELNESERYNSMLNVKEYGKQALEQSIEALNDALCELRMMPAINRDELKKSLRYAQNNLVIDYDSMNYDQIKALDDSLDAIFEIVEKLIGEEDNE